MPSIYVTSVSAILTTSYGHSSFFADRTLITAMALNSVEGILSLKLTCVKANFLYECCVSFSRTIIFLARISARCLMMTQNMP